MREWIERCATQAQQRGIFDRDCTTAGHPGERRIGRLNVGPLMIQMLEPRENLAQFDTVRRPSGEIECQQFDGVERSLHPAQFDSVGHVCAQRPCLTTG